MQKCHKNRTANKKNSSFELKWAKSQTKSVLFFTKYSIFIVDVKSGRFIYQSRRAGDEAKKRKSPAKSGRVGITGKGAYTPPVTGLEKVLQNKLQQYCSKHVLLFLVFY